MNLFKNPNLSIILNENSKLTLSYALKNLTSRRERIGNLGMMDGFACDKYIVYNELQQQKCKLVWIYNFQKDRLELHLEYFGKYLVSGVQKGKWILIF